MSPLGMAEATVHETEPLVHTLRRRDIGHLCPEMPLPPKLEERKAPFPNECHCEPKPHAEMNLISKYACCKNPGFPGAMA